MSDAIDPNDPAIRIENHPYSSIALNAAGRDAYCALQSAGEALKNGIWLQSRREREKALDAFEIRAMRLIAMGDFPPGKVPDVSLMELRRWTLSSGAAATALSMFRQGLLQLGMDANVLRREYSALRDSVSNLVRLAGYVLCRQKMYWVREKSKPQVHWLPWSPSKCVCWLAGPDGNLLRISRGNLHTDVFVLSDYSEGRRGTALAQGSFELVAKVADAWISTRGFELDGVMPAPPESPEPIPVSWCSHDYWGLVLRKADHTIVGHVKTLKDEDRENPYEASVGSAASTWSCMANAINDVEFRAAKAGYKVVPYL